jgi:hypothetical protein
LAEVRISILSREQHLRYAFYGDTTKNFGVRCAVKTQECEATREESKEVTKTKTSEEKEPQGREEPILEPGGRSIAVSGKLLDISEAREPAN